MRDEARALPGDMLAHVAIIMDGNGRWAARRGLPRLQGHRRGADTVREIVEACPEHGVRYLTLFAFSTENWKRPREEVSGLMAMFRRYMRKEAAELIARGVRVRFIGERGRLAPSMQEMMASLEERTLSNDKLHLTIAINYGGRDEMARAARRLAEEVARGEVKPEAVSERVLARFLDTDGLPDPDLVIRTSGETRISNFLLWQAAYAEFAFVDDCWPDFNALRFGEVLADFALRERRFGAVSA
ncbi:MAG TPA: polyprenyl diphosphate synthase [Paracoccaceae bacterium]|nr:polyprenyl diphosphate synthase [Paracoccaceae bacterium]